MGARLQTAVLAAALVLTPSARADETDDAGIAPPDTSPSVPDVFVGPVRPILLVAIGGVSGGLTLGADLGLRVAPVTARFAWRGEFMDAGDYLTFPSGRLGWIFAERSWISAHAGVGAGRLTRTFDDPTRPSVSSPAVVGELGALIMPAWAVGPLLGLHLEALVPVGAASPAGAALHAPVVSVVLNVNVVVVLWMALERW